MHGLPPYLVLTTMVALLWVSTRTEPVQGQEARLARPGGGTMETDVLEPFEADYGRDSSRRQDIPYAM